MAFNSIPYFLFFSFVFWAFWAAAGRLRLQKRLLLLASLFFYGFWNPIYLSLILFVIGVTWVCAMRIAERPHQRTAWFWAGITASLSVLAVFKYTGFAVSTLEMIWGAFGASLPFSTAFAQKILLPVGISFYTFQAVSYLVDVYRESLAPEASVLDYALYVSFFPQLVAGPIVRATDFLPQLKTERTFPAENAAAQGMVRIAMGLFKKIVIADYIAINLVDRVFDAPEMMSSLETIAGIYGYTLQIYCDFSAYSDIAIGSAMLLGFSLPENFRAPFLAENLSDFWKRWHISLSSWLKDYLYIPLGGNRHGQARTLANLLITMLLGGLWHGPSWTFVFWGFLHGAGLAAMRIAGWTRPAPHRIQRALRTLFTFHFVVLAFVFFRAPSFSAALRVLSRAWGGPGGAANLPATVIAALAAGFILHAAPENWSRRAAELFARLWAPVQAAAVLAYAFGLQQAASSAVVPFIYFQF